MFKDAIGITVNDLGIVPLYFEANAWASRPGLKYQTRLDGFSLAESVERTN